MRTFLYLLAVGIAASCLGSGCSGTAHEAALSQPAQAERHPPALNQRCFKPRLPPKVKLASTRAADPARGHHSGRFRPDGMSFTALSSSGVSPAATSFDGPVDERMGPCSLPHRGRTTAVGGEHHCFAPGEPRSTLVEARTGQPVGQLQVKSKAGRALMDGETTVKKVVRS